MSCLFGSALLMLLGVDSCLHAWSLWLACCSYTDCVMGHSNLLKDGYGEFLHFLSKVFISFSGVFECKEPSFFSMRMLLPTPADNHASVGR